MNDIAMTLDLLWGTVLAASLAASAAALIALVAERLIARRAPAVAVFLWLLIGLRFLLPAAPASPFSIWNWMPAGDSPSFAVVVGKSLPAPLGMAPSNAHVPLPTEPLASPSTVLRETPAISWPTAPVVLWLLGVALLVGFRAERLRRFHRRLASSTVAPSQRLSALWEECRQRAGTRSGELVVTACVPGPAVFGLRRPAVLLPVGFEERLTDDQVRMVLLHELLHVRRRDLVTTALGEMVAIVHWFNPLAWLAARRLEAACESACDAAVLTLIGRTRRTEYGRLIVEMIEDGWRRSQFQAPTSVVGTLALFGRRSQIQGRIDMILQGTSVSKWRRWSCWLSAAALAAVLLTDRGKVVAEDEAPNDVVMSMGVVKSSEGSAPSEEQLPLQVRTYHVRPVLDRLIAARKLSMQAAKDTLLTEFMDPKIWKTAKWNGDVLLLDATAAEHEELAADLAVMEHSSVFYLCLEMRLLTIDEHFFERVGLDFDITTHSPLDANGLKAKSDRQEPVALMIDGKEYRWSGEDFDNPRPMNSYSARLKPEQCKALLDAAQKCELASTLSAPRITLLNGRSAYCSCGEVRGNTSLVIAGKSKLRPSLLRSRVMIQSNHGNEETKMTASTIYLHDPQRKVGALTAPEAAFFGWQLDAQATHRDDRGKVRIQCNFSQRELPRLDVESWWRGAGQRLGLITQTAPAPLNEAYFAAEADVDFGETLLLGADSADKPTQTLLLITPREIDFNDTTD